MNGEHVKLARRHMLNFDVLSRVRIIQQNVWVDCPQAALVMRMIKNIVQTPLQIQAPCMLVCGEGGTGKTSLVNHLKSTCNKWEEKIIFMALNENPGNLHFRELLLESIGIPNSNRNLVKPTLPAELAEYVRLRNIRAIVIDEFHDALLLNRSDQLKTLSTIKGLSGEPYCLSVIGFGTSLARNALTHDAQLLRRYHIHELPRWTESEHFRAFLATLEENLPLREPSLLYSEEMVKFLLNNSNGIMDNVVKLIKHGAILAISNGEEKVTVEYMRRSMENPWAFKV